jgi:SAM-dependent methyltransferase
VTGPLRQAWEDEADAWAAWARAPDHDAFWHHTLPHLLELVPEPGRLTLDLGSGEGRFARELTARGHRVVGLDASPTLARLATTHPKPTTTVLADLAALPLPDGTADLAVACMSFQDVDDLHGAAREAARILRPGGRLCIAIVHPINSAGRFVDPSRDAPFVITGSYISEFHYADALERNGLAMTFHSIHRPIEAYSRALEAAGLVIEALREPAWTDPDPASRDTGWHRVPIFCLLRAARP